MKRILLSVFSLLIVCLSYADVKLNGVEYTIDTLSMFPAGPGTTYYELRLLRADNGKGRLDAFLLAVDTRNPYLHMEQVLGTGKLVGTERPSKMATRSTTDTKIFFAGVNGDFFATEDNKDTPEYNEVGRPTSSTIINNEYVYTPKGNRTARRLGAVDTDGRGITANKHSISMKLVLADTTLEITHANYTRKENELVLYNYHNASTTSTDAYGTEVQIQLLEGEKWQTSGKMKAKVTKVEDQVGSMPLDKDHAVLSGHGTMATELKKLKVGDEVTLNFKIKFYDDQTEEYRQVNIAQAIGADKYTMILVNGVIAQEGFWNEIHPRTGFGVSQTRDTTFMIVIDGRGVSTGCTTKVMAEILQHYGAYNAVNWDGGGSSCLYVRPMGPLNNGSDGQERACGNAMFTVAHVPEVDNEVVTIAPYMPNYYLPRSGVAAPQFLGYNKYGVLVETNVSGIQLSCAPEVGEILADGRFLASGANGGKLVATWGDITTELDVRIVSSAPIAIRLDSVLCDSYHPYAVEVQGTVGNNTVEVLSSALTWTSADPSIATINEKGELVGVSNGRVMVTGKLGDFSDSIIVDVEISETAKGVWDDFRNAASWVVTGSPTSFKPALSIPEDASAPVNLKFTYGSGRNKFVQLAKDSLLYSLPEKILVPMTTNATFEKVIITLRANNATQPTQVTFLNPKVGEENILEIDVKEKFGTDVSIFPIRFVSMKMVPTSPTPNGECYVTLPGIFEVYTGQTTDVENVMNSNATSPNKFIKNGTMYIQSNNQTFNILGVQVNE